ncbi:PAS domain S-box protein [Halorientalis pallida]|uniref:PAS domain S-box protein n=1 Tax=Halorientalis pallida TaxID=2479928 RepID=A0A498KUB5_9EURY|nr:PAS domain S-box protein [Halorientalis pallida]RXK48562.1 PAS domain S-box protein [Halorientalis pallida]
MSRVRGHQGDWWVDPESRSEWPDPEDASQTILDTLTDLLYVFDRSGRLVDWNEKFETVLGYSEAELAELDPLTLVADCDRERAVDALGRVAAGEEVTEQLRLETADGRLIPHEVTAAPLYEDDEVWGLAGTARNVSDRRERERDLSRYKSLLETVGDGVYVLDEDLRVAKVNDAMTELAGYDRDEILGRHFSAFMDSEAVDRSKELAATLQDTDRTVETIEYDLVRKDGTSIPVEGRFSLVSDDGYATIGLVRDISDRRERERDLRRYKSLLETIGDGVYVVDDDRHVRKVNDAMLEMVGADREDVLGRHVSAFTDPETAERGFGMSESLKRGDESLTTMEFDLHRADGTRLPVEGRFGLVHDEEYSTIGLIRDISERKARERELERYETVLETVGDGVYVMGEDLRLKEANDTLAALFGRDRETIMDAHLTEFVTEETAQRGIRARRELADRDGKAVATIQGTAVDGDGEEFPIEVRFMPLEGDLSSLGLIRDVSDRRERAELLEQLHCGTRELMAAETHHEVAETAAEVSQRHFAFATTGVRMLTEDDELEPVAVATDDERLDEMPPTYAVGEGFVGEAYEGGEPVVVDDMRDLDTDFDYDPARSGLLFPIEGYGMISIASTEPAAFDETHRELGRLFAADVESAFRRADREEKLRERTEELQRYETLVETMSDGVYMTDENHDVRMVNGAAEAKLGFDPAAFEGLDARAFGSDNVVAKARAQRQEMLDGERSVGTVEGTLRSVSGEEIPVENRFSLLPLSDGEFAGTVGVVRDITERKESERRLRTQRDELETLNRINELVQETIGALAAAATAEEIEETVCERLGGSSLYRFAFTGGRRPSDEFVEPNAWAGEGSAYLEEVEIPVEMEHERAGPVAKTFETGQVTVTNDVESDPLFEPFREPALDHGFRSVAVVPFTHRTVTHGMLAVYADRPGAFSDRERKAFEVLGEMVGFAISATQNRQLIESDSPVEMTLELEEPDTFFGTVSATLDCTCRLLGSAKASGGDRLHYVAVTAPPDEVRALADESGTPTPHSLPLVTENDDHAVFEARVRPSITSVLFESGVKPITVEAEGGQVTVEAAAPRGFDLRELTERLDERFGGVTLAAKREGDGWPEASEEPCAGVDDKLTDRQRAALSAAYFAGYFDWPRDSTAEEVADSLDIASPTFHQHLRHALRKLLATYFDDGRT